MLLALLLSQLLPTNPLGPIVTNPATLSRPALFEAFRGPGTFGPCSTTAPTGAKGEALTFSRASTATCTKTSSSGFAVTGIANGDLVALSSGQPRIEYGSNGRTGLRIEPVAATNLNLQSNDWSNAAYSNVTAGAAAAPTVTANSGTDPFGVLAAAKIDFPATGAGDVSVRTQVAAAGCSAVTCAYSVFVRGVSTSGTIDVGSWGSAATGTPLAFTDTGWARGCVVTANAGSPGVFVGNDTRDNGGVSRPAQSVYVSVGQVETGSICTSPITTTGAAGTRVAEKGDFVGVMASNATRSLAFTVTPHPGMTWAASGATVQFVGGAAGAGITDPYFWPYSNGGKINLETRNTGTPSPSIVSGAGFGDLPTTLGSFVRIAVYMKSTHIGLCMNGSCTTETAFTPGAFTFTRLSIGHAANSNPGIYTDLQADPDPFKAR